MGEDPGTNSDSIADALAFSICACTLRREAEATNNPLEKAGLLYEAELMRGASADRLTEMVQGRS